MHNCIWLFKAFKAKKGDSESHFEVSIELFPLTFLVETNPFIPRSHYENAKISQNLLQLFQSIVMQENKYKHTMKPKYLPVTSRKV